MTTETTSRPDYQPYTDWHCEHHRDEAYAGPVLYVLVDETETTATPLCTDCAQSLLLTFAAQQEAEAERRPRSFEVITVAAYIEALRGLPPIGCPWPAYGEDETGAIAPSGDEECDHHFYLPARPTHEQLTSLVEDAMGHACAHPREHREF
ncbi:MAG: hypothetical protein F4Y35_08590 [Chloroflexi bacterium]|nr:hypothetical protein [Chloroflexota bacterium]